MVQIELSKVYVAALHALCQTANGVASTERGYGRDIVLAVPTSQMLAILHQSNRSNDLEIIILN